MTDELDPAEAGAWTPTRIRWGDAPSVEWRRLGGRRFVEPFFEDTVRAALSDPAPEGRRRRSTLEVLAAIAEADPGLAPSGLVFHLSRCGSTLVSRMLAAPPWAVVLSEAPPIDAIVRAPIDDRARVRWLRALVSVLGRRRLGPERALFLKLDCWHMPELALFRLAFPAVPWIFVYRDPLEILVSHARRRGSHMVPGLLEPASLGLGATEATAMSLDEYGARVLGAIAACAAGEPDGRLLVHHRELPGAVVDRVAAHFGLQLAPADRARMLEVAAVHAKRPDEIFTDDGAAKQRAATTEQRALAERFCGAPYRALEAATADAPASTPRGRVAVSRSPGRAGPASLRLPLRFDPAPLRRDLAPVDAALVPHFNAAYYAGDWSGIALRSPGGVADRIYPDPTRADDYADTPILERCPALRAVLAQLRCPLQAARLLRLGPRSSIREHADHHLGLEEGVVRLHVPITTGPGVDFIVDGVRVEMAPGECWYHDFARPHAVQNRGDEPRVHFVIDCVVDEWLRALIARGEPTAR